MTCEVPELVRELLAHDRHAHRDPRQDGLGEGGPDAQPVDEVVYPVPEDDHPGDGGDGAAATRPLQGLHVLHSGAALGGQCCGSMTFWWGSGSADPCL